MMGGMWPPQATMQAYTDAKTQTPKVFADANALLTKASTLSSALAKHNLTLTGLRQCSSSDGNRKSKSEIDGNYWIGDGSNLRCPIPIPDSDFHSDSNPFRFPISDQPPGAL